MTVQVINARWQMRRKTAAQWASTNEVLRQGEKGYEIDTGREKNGDGVTGWNGLAYAGGSGGVPDGGTTGQALKKLSNDDQDIGWVDDETGSGSVADTSTTLTLTSNATTIDASVGYRAKYRLTTTTTAGITITISNLPTGDGEWEAELMLLATAVPASIAWAGATVAYMPRFSFLQSPLALNRLTRIDLKKQREGRITARVWPAESVTSPVLSTEAIAWLSLVQSADGAELEGDVYNAMGAFATWRIPFGGVCYLPIGARTLAGSLIPMVGPSPTIGSFDVSHDRKTGWNKSTAGETGFFTNYLDSSRPENSGHMAVQGNFPTPSEAVTYLMGILYNPTSWSTLAIDNRAANRGTQVIVNTVGSALGPYADSGFISATRENTSQVGLRQNSASFTFTQASTPPIASNYFIGTRQNYQYKLASIGAYIDPVIFESKIAEAIFGIEGALS